MCWWETCASVGWGQKPWKRERLLVCWFVLSLAAQVEKKTLQSVEKLFSLAKAKGRGALGPWAREKKNDAGHKVATVQVRFGSSPTEDWPALIQRKRYGLNHEDGTCTGGGVWRSLEGLQQPLKSTMRRRGAGGECVRFRCAVRRLILTVWGWASRPSADQADAGHWNKCRLQT